jgi:hypothetical protein
MMIALTCRLLCIDLTGALRAIPRGKVVSSTTFLEERIVNEKSSVLGWS